MRLRQEGDEVGGTVCVCGVCVSRSVWDSHARRKSMWFLSMGGIDPLNPKH